MRIYNAPPAPLTESDIPIITTDSSVAMTKRVAALESSVNQLSEQVKRLTSALEINKRDIRRQGSSLNSISSVVNSKLS